MWRILRDPRVSSRIPAVAYQIIGWITSFPLFYSLDSVRHRTPLGEHVRSGLSFRDRCSKCRLQPLGPTGWTARVSRRARVGDPPCPVHGFADSVTLRWLGLSDADNVSRGRLWQHTTRHHLPAPASPGRPRPFSEDQTFAGTQFAKFAGTQFAKFAGTQFAKTGALTPQYAVLPRVTTSYKIARSLRVERLAGEMMFREFPRAGLVLGLVAALGVAGAAAWLLVSLLPGFEYAGRVPDTDPRQEVMAQTLARTLQESKTGVEEPILESVPSSSPSPSITPRTGVPPAPPAGYEFVRHHGSMVRASLIGPITPLDEPGPAWLDPDMAFKALARQALEAGRDWTFAAARILPGTQGSALEQTLAPLGVEIEGYSGDYARIRVPSGRTDLEAILRLPGVLGIGAVLPELKAAPGFVDQSFSKPPSERVPVFVTLMVDDPQGAWRRELTTLGLTVGAYDADIRTYTANMPFSALESVLSADFVMAVEPVGLVRSLLDTAVPVMGADALRDYLIANNGFTGVTGRGIAIGVMDTGLNIRHVDVSSGRDSICGANFYRGEDFDLWIDLRGHGTHVVGTIAGAGKDDPRLAGMAPNLSDIRVAKVLNFSGFGSGADIRRGMDYLASRSRCTWRGRDAALIKPHIVNMSLGQTGISHSGRGVGERKLDHIVHTEAQLYVVAQSNASAHGFSNFGTAKNSLSVGAVDDAGYLAHFSSHGPTADGRLAPNIVATGIQVTSAAGASRRSGDVVLNGTSMAAPFVSGVAALLMEAQISFQNEPALTRARLMASAIRPDAFLEGTGQFPRDNSNGPGDLQNKYGLGLVSTRASLLSRDHELAWTTGSAISLPLAETYEYIDIEVPEGAHRLDLVMTWDEQPADTLTRSVLSNLDLWVDRGVDCAQEPCGEYSSLSTRDNVEWLFIDDPGPGTYRVKVIPSRLYGDEIRAAIAWTIIRGDGTPQLDIQLEESLIVASDDEVISVDARVSVNQFLASGTTLHLSCGPEVSAVCPRPQSDSSIVFREDGIPRPLDASTPGVSISLGEIAVGEERRVSLKFNPSTSSSRSRLYLTASAWNATSATAHVDFAVGEVPAELPRPQVNSPPMNDAFRAVRKISGSLGSLDIDLLLASREPGEPGVRAESRSAWFAWTAPGQGVYRFRLVLSESQTPFEASMNIYTGDELVALKPHANKQGSELSFTAVEGEVYKLQLVSDSWYLQPLRLEWESADSRPANDNFYFPQEVSGTQGKASGSNEGATLQRIEYLGGLAATVWFRWIAPTEGYWSFRLRSNNLRIAAFSGATLRNLRLISSPDPSTFAMFPVVANATYYIAVAAKGADASGAPFEITWRQESKAQFHTTTPNDLFADAIQIQGVEGRLRTPPRILAGVEPNEPGATGIGTTWWHWTAPETSLFTWRINGTSAARLSLFTGGAIDELKLVASASGGASMRLDAKAGSRYSIALGRSQSSMNNGFLGWPSEMQWGVSPANDDRENAAQLEGTDGSQYADLSHATIEVGEPTDSVGYESVWWHWRVPSSGWYRFWIEDDPQALILSLYPRGRGPFASNEPVASSDRMWPANGRVEAWVHAGAGEQYDLRIARRPLVDPQHTATLRWQSTGPAPLLAFRHTETNASIGSASFEDALSNPQSLVSDDSGSRLFATSNNRLLAFERDVVTGGLVLLQTLDMNSAEGSGVFSDTLASARLRWDGGRDRLLAHSGSSVLGFSLSEDENSLRDSTTLNIVAGTIPKTPRRLVTNRDDTLVFALYKVPDLLQVLRFDAADPAALTLVQTLRGEGARNGSELLEPHLEGAEDMEIASDDSHLYVAADQGLVVFAINPVTNMLSRVRTISLSEPSTAGVFQGIQGIRNLELDSVGRYLFATGQFAPQVAIFDVSANSAWPAFMDSVSSFHYEDGFEFSNLTPFHRRPGYFGACNFAERHGELPAVDVLCRSGFYTAWWDASRNELAVIDYANSGSLDHSGSQLPELLVGSRQLAQSPNGDHVYLPTGSGPNPHAIHVFERASGRTLDERGDHARLK